MSRALGVFKDLLASSFCEFLPFLNQIIIFFFAFVNNIDDYFGRVTLRDVQGMLCNVIYQ